ncbi:TetR/AcrR family transcriptional regulator [Microbacterium sp. STN6]|uniref:TetR/AcrR family transcriptional regulator n=1 Tax=Microbacterium sp. STN6 TaxID=2995588 RepID=UPI002260C2F3|nr:TetR/AcrR family transcriptional regulator [Microbacterium sp. STN6]MCX7522125.1 TetR/AcrR family transcriptional regulator [Microbacterium sp. STN6]
MNASEKPEPVSRRNRPAKAPLSRRAIVDAALRIARERGIEAVTMRRVAEALDTAAGSLYVYVANRDELVAYMLESVFGGIDYETDSASPWQDRAVTLVGRQIAAFSQYPGLALSLAGAIPVGENAVAAGERMLSLLVEAGIEPQRAAWGVDLIGLYATAAAVESTAHVSRDAHDLVERDYLSVARERYAAMDPERYPTMSAMVDLLLSGDGEQRQEWAVRVLLAGIVATAVPGSSSTAVTAPVPRTDRHSARS